MPLVTSLWPVSGTCPWVSCAKGNELPICPQQSMTAVTKGGVSKEEGQGRQPQGCRHRKNSPLSISSCPEAV
jgi:hypothetical protein